MTGSRFGIRREDKSRWERRVPLTPDHVRTLKEDHGVTCVVQPSEIRIFPDDAYNSPGFCADDISIPELGYHYDAEDDDGWVALGFIRTDNTLSQRYLVQLIELGAETRVRRMELDETQKGQLIIGGFGSQVERAVLVVSALAPKTTELADYQYSIAVSAE